MDHGLWDGFAEAVVQITLDEGTSVILVPAPPGSVDTFPFDGPVHIITAYNPRGDLSDEAANRRSHAELAAASGAAGWSALPTVGSGPDGSMPEPGLAIFDITRGEAVALGARFGQASTPGTLTASISLVCSTSTRGPWAGGSRMLLACPGETICTKSCCRSRHLHGRSPPSPYQQGG